MPRAESIAFHRLQVARARQFLRAHVAEEVTLGSVARAAGASPYHFARLYHALVGETVFQSLTRMRLATAARALCEAPRLPVSEIALAVGYCTPSSFNKAFRLAVGVSPSRLRGASVEERRALLARLAAPPKALIPRGAYRLSRAPEIRRRSPMRVVCVRELGPYTEVAPLAFSKLWQKLPRDGVAARGAEIVGASYDDPRAVDEGALRYDAGITVSAGVAAPPGTVVRTLEGGDFAVFRHRGPYRYIAASFSRISGDWVLRTRARVRPSPCLEIYCNNPASTPEPSLLTELWVPLELRS